MHLSMSSILSSSILATSQSAIFAGMSTGELLAMLAPVVLLQLGLAVYCLMQIWRKGVANLNPWIWSTIVLLLNFVGPIAFLLVGKKRWEEDDHA